MVQPTTVRTAASGPLGVARGPLDVAEPAGADVPEPAGADVVGGSDAPTAFTAAGSAITDAFGDPTRRRIYLFTRDHGGADGVTASAMAPEVGVHPNVARHHLDKLAAGGYVEVDGSGAADAGARRAGRPSKHYVAVGGASEHHLPVRSD